MPALELVTYLIYYCGVIKTAQILTIPTLVDRKFDAGKKYFCYEKFNFSKFFQCNFYNYYARARGTTNGLGANIYF